MATLLESPPPWSSSLGRYSICAGGPRVENDQPQFWTPPIGQVFPLLQELMQLTLTRDLPLPHPDLPFIGGWLGWLGYEVAWEIEQLPTPKPDPLPFPPAFWYEPECFAVLDHEQQHMWLATPHPEALESLQTKILQSEVLQPSLTTDNSYRSNQNIELGALKFETDSSAFEAAVLRAKDYIRAGDIFQANLSARFRVTTHQDAWSIYQRLTQTNPSPFASFWKTPWGSVVSCSPERLVQLQGQCAQTRPIAGTRPRGTQPPLDHQKAEELLASPKEQAEHIMLVDLERNDLGRVCVWGSVQVDELLSIERYSHVMHLVSNIRGTLRPEVNGVDLMRALFPGGTITGCPKVRCMEIIQELEPSARNLFYGSCGYLDGRGNLDLNILIRTLLVPNRSGIQTSGPTSTSVWGQVGAGIVADSQPRQEWEECLHKAQALLAVLGL